MLPYGPSRYLQLPVPLWCCVDWHNRLAQMLHILVLLLIPSRNFSFIRIAVLHIHYAVCQPLQLSPCQEVHPQGVIKTSTFTSILFYLINQKSLSPVIRTLTKKNLLQLVLLLVPNQATLYNKQKTAYQFLLCSGHRLPSRLN